MELRCLYLQQNLLELEHVVPPPGWNGAPLPLPGAPPAPSPLAHLVNLVTLDLSQNRLSVLSGLEGLVKFNTLNAAPPLGAVGAPPPPAAAKLWRSIQRSSSAMSCP